MASEKKTKGKQKITMKLIENKQDRMITFSKRRSGIYKKASELVTMCGAEVAFLVFSPAGKAYSFGHPSLEAVMGRYLGVPMPSNEAAENHQKKMIEDLSKVHNELMNKLGEEEKKKRGKVARGDAGGSGGEGMAWWEIPINELSVQQLHETNARYKEILEMVIKKIEEKNMKAN